MKDPVITAQPAAPTTTPDGTPAAHSWSAIPPLATRPASSPPKVTNVLMATALAVLALTVIFIAGSAFWMGRTLTRPQPAPPAVVAPQQPTTAAGASPALQASTSAQTQDAPPVSSDQPEKNQPKDDQPKEEELILTGIVEGGGEPYAVINGVIVGVGEQIKESTLLEIGKGKAKVRRPDGRETVLSIPK